MQFELFDKKPEKEEEIKKMRWDKRETFWSSVVHNTHKEHACARCGQTIPIGNRAEVTVDVDGGKPDFTKPQYWHPNEKCPKI